MLGFKQAGETLVPRENLIYKWQQSPCSSTPCPQVELPEMPSDTPEGAGRYRKKQGRESIKGKNNTAGLKGRRNNCLVWW